MIHITIATYPSLRPSYPPRATLNVDDNGGLHVDVEDIQDPESEALAAARVILEHFIEQYAATR